MADMTVQVPIKFKIFCDSYLSRAILLIRKYCILCALFWAQVTWKEMILSGSHSAKLRPVSASGLHATTWGQCAYRLGSNSKMTTTTLIPLEMILKTIATHKIVVLERFRFTLLSSWMATFDHSRRYHHLSLSEGKSSKDATSSQPRQSWRCELLMLKLQLSWNQLSDQKRRTLNTASDYNWNWMEGYNHPINGTPKL